MKILLIVLISTISLNHSNDDSVLSLIYRETDNRYNGSAAL